MFSSHTPAFLLLLALAMAVALVAAGAWGYRAWGIRVAKLQQRIPKKWPLAQRALVSTEEFGVWRWLMHTFPEHRVMIKLPLTRFAMPHEREQANALHQLLGAVYCTFTVCGVDGKVVGCVDVPAAGDSQRRGYRIKRSLLGQFGLPYWVVRADNLPDPVLMRHEFLNGHHSAAPMERHVGHEEQEMLSAQASLRSALSRQRQNREHSDFGILPSELANMDDGEDRHGRHERGSWQTNSFLFPVDSREGELR